MSKLVSMRLPENLIMALDKLSKITERSKTFLVKKALKNYIEENADYQIAIDRLNDKDDNILNSKQMRKELGI